MFPGAPTDRQGIFREPDFPKMGPVRLLREEKRTITPPLLSPPSNTSERAKEKEERDQNKRPHWQKRMFCHSI